MDRKSKPVVLIILDGWGYTDEVKHNPIKAVATPTMDFLWQNYPHTLIEASGEAVGLPVGQIGNSEVGHLHIGAGRKVPQDLTRIDNDIKSQQFFQNPTLVKAIQLANKNNKAVHVLGLLSPGGVHSHERQIKAMMDMLKNSGIQKRYLHAILDGRDTPPKSALNSLKNFDSIVSIIGRYYAMDRDKRWERTQKAYDLLTQGKADYHAASAEEGLALAYERGESDEFVKPTLIHAPNESPITIQEGDVVIFMNYRPDRARQLTQAFIGESPFPHKPPKLGAFVTLTRYAKNLPSQVAYPPLQLQNTLGEFISKQGLHQLRLAETEKYAHVTYFLNGGTEEPFPNEDRELIPSPKIATYDLQPEMSAYELTDHLVKAIESQYYDLIVCNYANPDMIGHTGIEPAAQKAISVVDECLKKIIAALQKVHGEALITADHGNIEKMFDETTGQPHTAHTTNLVPLIYFGRKATFSDHQGALDDVAPTLLAIMGYEKPREMTGTNLIQTRNEDAN